MTATQVRFVLLAALVLAVAASVPARAADDGPRFPGDRIMPAQWQAYLDETRAKPGARVSEAVNQIIVDVPAELAVYLFTARAHPAYPAVVRRRVVLQDGSIGVDRSGRHAGDRAAFAAWWRRLDDLERQMTDDLEWGARR